MWGPRPTAALLTLLLLGCGAARADDAPRKPPEDPDLGFLEFLGSVDRLSDVMPDYLSRAEARGKTAAGTTAVPPPPPPPTPPNGAGGHNNG